MQSLGENPQLCSSCRKRIATKKYTDRHGDSSLACATCLERLELDEEFQYKYREIIELKINDRYDEALASLDAFLEANRHRDYDSWLARSIAMERAIALEDAGRYSEAEQACEAWAQLGFDDVPHRWMHARVKADILDAMGRPREALAALEEARGYRDRKALSSAMLLLVPVAELSEKLGQPVDPKWRDLAEAWAKSEGFDMPADDSLGEAIRKLDKMRRKLGPADEEDEPEDEP